MIQNHIKVPVSLPFSFKLSTYDALFECETLDVLVISTVVVVTILSVLIVLASVTITFSIIRNIKTKT